MSMILMRETFKRIELSFEKIPNKRIILLFTILIVFFLFFLFNLLNSIPGDLFYPIKRSVFFKIPESSIEQLTHYEKLLEEDFKALNLTISEDKCVQLLLVEEQITLDSKSFIEAAKNTKDYTNNNLIYNPQTSQFETNCKYQKSLIDIYKIIQISTFKFKTDEFKINFLAELHSKAEEKYKSLSELFKEKEFNSQDSIETATGILVVSKHINENVVNLVNNKNYTEAYSLLVYNNIALDFAKDALEKDTVNHNIIKSYIRTICSLTTSENCIPEVIDSKWNSIVRRESSEELYEMISKLFVQYMELLK